ncbi:MAG: tryptophan halogenase family protein [Sphingomonas sp.]
MALEDQHVRHVIVAGGGTAGWMAAAVLSRSFPAEHLTVTVVDSAEIGTIGVGEATVPPILQINGQLGLDEDELVRRTQATYKLGIEFSDWGALGDRYFHPFGFFGADLGGVAFHHHWLRTRQGALTEYSLPAAAAYAGRFGRPSNDPRNVLSRMSYALHLDATRYAELLREVALAHGVQHVEGRIVDVALDDLTGFVDHLQLEDGRALTADLFIDCTGFQGLLIERALKTGHIDWSHWLPMDRAIAVQSASRSPPPPYTRSIAGKAGWRWCIPLQHRIGNGHVYSSACLQEDEAADALLTSIDSPLVSAPRTLRFKTGRRRRAWHKNVVALGLASGFVEPLESTSIHLIQRGIVTLMSLFPSTGFSQPEIDLYNRLMASEWEAVRDFVILHYKQTRRDDTPFWRQMQAMDVPDSLNERIALFANAGRVVVNPADLFQVPSWVAVMLGQGIRPRTYDPLADNLPFEEASKSLQQMRAVIQRGVHALASHAAFLDRTA